jgi:hypothetical protein
MKRGNGRGVGEHRDMIEQEWPFWQEGGGEEGMKKGQRLWKRANGEGK